MSFIQVIPPEYKRSEMLYTYIKKKQEERQKIVIVCSEVRKAKYLQKLMCFWSTKSVAVNGRSPRKNRTINLNKFYTQDSMIMFTTNNIVNYINLVEEKIFDNNCTFIQYDPAIDLEKFLQLFSKCQNENYSFTSFLRQEEIILFLSKLKKHPNEESKEIKEISFNKYQIVNIMAQDPAAVLQELLEAERAEIVRELEAARATLNKRHQDRAYSVLKKRMRNVILDENWQLKASTTVRKYLDGVHEMRPIGIRVKIIESCIQRFLDDLNTEETETTESNYTQEEILAIERYNRNLDAIERYEQYLESVKWWNPFTWRRFDP